MNACTQRQPGSGPAVTTVAGYLLTRLAEAGVISVFGVPGDYNVGLLDAIAAGRTWPGSAWPPSKAPATPLTATRGCAALAPP
jgi:hypothetical protein